MKKAEHKLDHAAGKLFVLLCTACLLTACEHPKIFSSSELQLRSAERDEAPELIIVHITGGIAGLNQRFSVRENGAMALTENFPYGKTSSDMLSPAALADLNADFLNNRFLLLDENYLTPNVADFIYYEITYLGNNFHKTVMTDYEAAPSALRKIIDALNTHMLALANSGLELSLYLSKDSLASDETVVLQLQAQNRSDRQIVLFFRDGQRFNFVAYQSLALDAPANRESTRTEWEWQHDKVFEAATASQPLLPGQSLVYEIEWDGTDEAGNRLAGEFWVAGQLVSAPGGATPAVPLFIAAKSSGESRK